MAAEPRSPSRGRTLSGRLVRAGTRVGRQVAEDAREEAAEDAQRISLAMMLLTMTAVLASLSVVLGEAALAMLLTVQGLGPAEALGLMALANLLLSLGCMAGARILLGRPVLRRTRERLQRVREILGELTD